MYFFILLCHASMHCWNASSWILLSSVFKGPFMPSMSSKRVCLMISLILEKKSHRTRSDEWGGCSSRATFHLARNCRILSIPNPATNISESSVIISQTQFFLSSWLVIIRTVNWRSPHTTSLSHSTLTSVLFVEGLPLMHSSFTSTRPFLILLCY